MKVLLPKDQNQEYSCQILVKNSLTEDSSKEESSEEESSIKKISVPS